MLFVIKHFTKYTLCCRTHLTTLSHLLAVGGVTVWIADIDVATKEAKSGVGLGCDIVDVMYACPSASCEISGHQGTDDCLVCKDTAQGFFSRRW